MTITKERLLKIQHWRETYGADSNVMLPAEEAAELARIALASLEVAPVGEVSEKRCGLVMDGTVDLGGKSTYRIIKGEKAMKRLPLGTKFYIAPPAPVVDADPVVFTDERNLRHIAMGRETSLIWGKQNQEVGDIPLYRHAQPVPVVPDECPAKIRELMASHSDALFNDGDAQEIWNACRDAILNAEPLHATPKGNRLRIAEGKLAEYSLSKREPQPTPESADRKMLKRLAVIMSGSDSGGEISALTVTAQSLVDRCKALALDKEKLAATESLVFEVKCPFPYGWGELKRRTNQDALFFSAYMVEGEEITELHRDIVSRTVDRLLKVIAVCQTDASFNGPTTWNPASLEEVNKRIVRESTGIPSREAIIAGGVLVQCPRCYNDSYRLNVNGLTHYWCDKCANSITSESK
ncbi:hypothetical protein NGUA23_04568 [Salmonella enterica]|uniref:hypothetical protein n=2 Tax=Salmonella enterica TaxID=28901 RepID=UPI00076BAE3F|nr:hypothetical protein [Salmonella enterica]GAR04937.1 hypothetical protein NGUA03_00047 [Salmonella enterica]GAR12494.1 hypothetical protein NGUA04_03095 [Salmonella enterica]GAR34264.1 hypothetical protein NGUA09_02800 [Salmonella enterica]GAR36109.1 hypothetical protein NGUA10_00107 [Salmonella enterica]GAR86164.1 hypothetical protein NGUA21_00280 [Salmonella enterica]